MAGAPDAEAAARVRDLGRRPPLGSQLPVRRDRRPCPRATKRREPRSTKFAAHRQAERSARPRHRALRPSRSGQDDRPPAAGAVEPPKPAPSSRRDLMAQPAAPGPHCRPRHRLVQGQRDDRPARRRRPARACSAPASAKAAASSAATSPTWRRASSRCAKRSSSPSACPESTVEDVWASYGRRRPRQRRRQCRGRARRPAVEQADVDELLDAGKRAIDRNGQVVLHAHPALYTIDRAQGVQQPIGLHAAPARRRHPRHRRRPVAAAEYRHRDPLRRTSA